jgi:hypothetical protein
VRLTLAIVAAFLGGYAAVHGLQRFAPEEVLAAVSFGLLPHLEEEDTEFGFGETVRGHDEDDGDNDGDDDDDDSPVAQLELADDERVLIFPPGVAEANGVVAAPVRAAEWVEQHTGLGSVLDVASLLRDVASLRGTELILDQSEARLEPLRARLERLRQAYDTGLVLLADVDLAERALRDEEMVRAEQSAARARTLRHIQHTWGTHFARAAADRAPLLEALADRRQALVQASLPKRLDGREFRAEVRSGDEVRLAEPIGPGYAEVAGMGPDAVLLLADGAGLRPGLRVEVSFVTTDVAEPGFVLPAGAVLFHGDGIWAYCDLGDGRYGRRALSGLRRFDRSWFVPESVLDPDARVVIRGGQMLLAEEFRADIMREDDD